MADILVCTLLAFAGLITLMAATAVALCGAFVLIVARKGDRPVQLSPRGAAFNAIGLAILIGWQALDLLAGLPL